MNRFVVYLSVLVGACLAAPEPGHAQTESQRVFLLIAKPGMLDPNFSKTVVLAVRPDDGGPIGVILNRPSTVELRSLYPDRAELAHRTDLVFLGGPVEPDALLFAFRSTVKPAKGLFVADNIYISGFSEVLNEILRHPEHARQQRFFTGFSGWAGGQLEDEIQRGGWYVLPFDGRYVFDAHPLSMYEDLLKRAVVPRLEVKRGYPLADLRAR